VARDAPSENQPRLHIFIEARHSGRREELAVSPDVSVAWLNAQAQTVLGVAKSVDIGLLEPLKVKWVLVERGIAGRWERLQNSEQRRAWATVGTPTGKLSISYDPTD
jgi:hypothetical protein